MSVSTPSSQALDIHPRLAAAPGLRDTLRPERALWTPAELRALTTHVAAELTTALSEVLRYTEPRRWWARLALTDGVELWLLSWLPGQQTAPHDHGGAAGSFTVLTGEIAESYRYPNGPIRVQRHLAGTSIGFGAGRAHQVSNVSTEGAATVHAYSPPLVETREYTSLRDIPGEIPPLPAPRVLR